MPWVCNPSRPLGSCPGMLITPVWKKRLRFTVAKDFHLSKRARLGSGALESMPVTVNMAGALPASPDSLDPVPPTPGVPGTSLRPSKSSREALGRNVDNRLSQAAVLSGGAPPCSSPGPLPHPSYTSQPAPLQPPTVTVWPARSTYLGVNL